MIFSSINHLIEYIAKMPLCQSVDWQFSVMSLKKMPQHGFLTKKE